MCPGKHININYDEVTGSLQQTEQIAFILTFLPLLNFPQLLLLSSNLINLVLDTTVLHNS